MILRMTTETSPEATLLRVGDVCQAAYLALQRGLVTADKLHKIAGWNPASDIHLHRHMTRREAMEDLKQVVPVGADAVLADDDNLGLAMSGLIVELPEDTIRIWHTADCDIPAPRSVAGREFVTQSSGEPGLFEPDELAYDGGPEMRLNNLIVQWSAQGREMWRYDLVRPIGYKNGKIILDWRYPLLTKYQATMEDISYRPRGDEHKSSGDAEDT